MKKNLYIVLSIIMLFSLVLASCTSKETATPATNPGYPLPDQTAQPVEGYPVPGQATTPAEGYPVPDQATTPAEGYPAPATVTKILVATDAAFPPLAMFDEATKELTGFDLELMNAIAAKAGFEVEYTNLSSDLMFAGLSTCQYDAAIAAISITDDRKKEMLFSDPYLDAGQIIVVQKGDETIKSKADLAGKTIGALLGTTGEIEAQAIEGVTYKPYATFEQAFLDLANGQIDAVIADNPISRGFIKNNSDQLMTVGDVFTNESYGIAFCKNRQDLVNQVNPALQAVIADGVVDQLKAKYFTGE